MTLAAGTKRGPTSSDRPGPHAIVQAQFQFWRFVQVQDAVKVLAQSAIEYPPMQKGASFTMEAVVAQI